jgi:hypothetical protein
MHASKFANIFPGKCSVQDKVKHRKANLTFSSLRVLMLSYWYWSPGDDIKVNGELFPIR